jgi:hypothetical protein
MGVGIEVTTLLEKLLKNWNFSSMDDRHALESLPWDGTPESIKVVNIWGFDSGMGA